MSRNEELKKHGIELRERICQFITDYTSKYSYAPTLREIGEGVGLKSSSSVHSHLTQLEIEGRIITKQAFDCNYFQYIIRTA